jgi:hypothetical protein
MQTYMRWIRLASSDRTLLLALAVPRLTSEFVCGRATDFA